MQTWLLFKSETPVQMAEIDNMHNRVHINRFTLMEVMIAGTILALAVVSTMGVIGGARSTLLRSEQRWARQHLLAQATEFYLLAGAYAVMPEGVLPEEFSASCEVYEVEDIHEDAMTEINGWILCEYHIQLFDASGVMLAENFVRKVLKTEDVDE